MGNETTNQSNIVQYRKTHFHGSHMAMCNSVKNKEREQYYTNVPWSIYIYIYTYIYMSNDVKCTCVYTYIIYTCIYICIFGYGQQSLNGDLHIHCKSRYGIDCHTPCRHITKQLAVWNQRLAPNKLLQQADPMERMTPLQMRHMFIA